MESHEDKKRRESMGAMLVLEGREHLRIVVERERERERERKKCDGCGRKANSEFESEIRSTKR